jgi:hypothetical protein
VIRSVINFLANNKRLIKSTNGIVEFFIITVGFGLGSTARLSLVRSNNGKLLKIERLKAKGGNSCHFMIL